MLIEEGVRITRGIGHASTGMGDTDDEPLVHVGPKRKARRQKGSNHSYAADRELLVGQVI